MFQTKLYVDEAWMKRFSFGLERFKKVKNGVHVCRCPFCGDSKKRKAITRFYFYTKKGQLFVHCKNCNYSHSFFVFVKDYAPDQFDEYKKETLLDSFLNNNRKPTESVLDKPKNKPNFSESKTIKKLRNTTNCFDLPNDHPAKSYLYSRGFEKEQIKRLLYTDDFQSVASQINKESAKKLEKEPRIVIPFYDKDGNINLIQGRALGKSGLKYITIKLHDDVDKTYGLESIDRTKTTYCVEGPIDSLFVDNCMATCDANLTRSDADVLIFDNEPRNPDIVKLIENAINEKRKVVIWPFSPDSKVDINDMIKNGVSQKMLMKVIRNCTYQGLTALIKFKQWKKV